MKVLLVNCVYGKGSTGKIVKELHKMLRNEKIDSIVCYGRGKKVKTDNVYKISNELYSKVNKLRGHLTGILYGGCFFSTQKLKKIIKKENPDVVHLHCINGYFVNIFELIKWLNQNRIKTLITLHAEFMYTANCGHSLDCDKWVKGCKNCPRLKEEIKSIFFDQTGKSWKKMNESFKNFGNNLMLSSVSPWLKERAEKSKFFEGIENRVIYNGINTKEVYRVYNNNFLREKYGIKENVSIILHVTASFDSEFKGGKYVLELAKKMLNKNIIFVIVGNKKNLASVPSNVLGIGRVNNDGILAKIYSSADITIITSKKETFSMVCAESLCCGTPVVGFKAGAPEQISLKEYSSFVEYGDVDELKNECIKMLERKVDKKIIANKANATYSSKKICRDYLKCYEDLISK